MEIAQGGQLGDFSGRSSVEREKKASRRERESTSRLSISKLVSFKHLLLQLRTASQKPHFLCQASELAAQKSLELICIIFKPCFHD